MVIDFSLSCVGRGAILMIMESEVIAIGLTTVGGKGDANALAEEAVRKGLAACVQIEGPIRSLYIWGEGVASDDEYRLVFKFSAAKRALLEDWLHSRHPYDLPQWVVIDTCQASAAYAKWVNG